MSQRSESLLSGICARSVFGMDAKAKPTWMYSRRLLKQIPDNNYELRKKSCFKESESRTKHLTLDYTPEFIIADIGESNGHINYRQTCQVMRSKSRHHSLLWSYGFAFAAGTFSIRDRAMLKISDIDKKITDLSRMKSALANLSVYCPGKGKPLSECGILNHFYEHEE